jgi:hypothetical protein
LPPFCSFRRPKSIDGVSRTQTAIASPHGHDHSLGVLKPLVTTLICCAHILKYHGSQHEYLVFGSEPSRDKETVTLLIQNIN